MLISEPSMLRPDPVLRFIAALNGGDGGGHQLQTGVYQVGHFGSSAEMPGYDHYPEGLSVGAYGVCDSAENLLAACPELVTSERQFVVRLTAIDKAKQSADGGWRWHKWGDYIGAHTPTMEYLYDEPLIDRVYVYHIFEKVGQPVALGAVREAVR